jgi:hypothetical protein
MSQDQFDDYIRRQIADHSTVFDAEGMWQSVQTRQKTRRPLVWWVAGCLLLALGLAAYALTAGEEKKGKGKPTEVSDKQLIAAKTATVSPQQVTVATSERAARVAAVQFRATAPTAARKPSSLVVAADMNPRITAPSVGNLLTNRQADSFLLLPATADHEPLAEAITEPNAVAKKQLNTELFPAAEYPSASASTAPLADPLPEAANELTAAPAAEQPYRKRSPKWFIGIGGSTYNPLRSLSSNDPESELLAEAIRRTEKPLEVVGTELQLGRYLSPGWTVQTGIAAHQQTERFEWTFEQLVVDTVIGIQSIIIDANGDSTVITGPIARYQQLSRFKRTFNRYTFIDIPLLTGYEFGEGALKFSVTGGAIINLVMQASGERLSAQEQPVALGEATAFRMRAGLSFQAGMGGSWELHPRWRLHAQLAMRYFPWTITQADSQLSQQYQWLGGQLSLRYLL